jgi:hypothetical protein
LNGKDIIFLGYPVDVQLISMIKHTQKYFQTSWISVP